MQAHPSYFDRIFNAPRSLGTLVLVSLLLLSLPILFAWLDGYLPLFIESGQWRMVLSPTAIALYIWYISPLMSRAGASVIRALRPLIEMDDDQFNTRIAAAEQINPRHELAAIAIGLLLAGLALYSSQFDQGYFWTKSYWFITTCLMYAILAWTIFIAISSTRVNATLHRMPMHFDILDPQPFEAVGRQSLLLALVFIGGITVSLVFTYQPAQLSSFEFWISNLLLVIFTVAIFFISMRPTHLILAGEKKKRLEPLTKRINTTCEALENQLESGQQPGDLPAQISALVLYEQRLQAARTWPYNIIILRTLFVSVFIPLISVLARLVFDLFFP